MRKVAIISELNLNNVNYGNRLQAFALNYYINKNFKVEADSIILKYYDKKLITKNSFFEIPKTKIKFIKKVLFPEKLEGYFEKRLKECNYFTKSKTRLSADRFTIKKLEKSDYDIFIVGSDVVFAQTKNGINRIRFLDFKKKKVRKLSYAASFGRDWIPKENEKIIKEKLDDFYAISVREKSSIKLLNNIGVNNVLHVCDPTLLLDKKEWENIASKPNEINENKKFIFVYLLGKDKKQRDEIKRIAQNEGMLIINIPHANGKISDVDDHFADIDIKDCSPGNWVWLIKNSSYFFTDSFHGCVFATIFEKKFLVLTRKGKENINNRMIDFMETIGAIDKFVDLSDVEKITSMQWDYQKINKNVLEFVKKSKKYLEQTLELKEK